MYGINTAELITGNVDRLNIYYCAGNIDKHYMYEYIKDTTNPRNLHRIQNMNELELFHKFVRIVKNKHVTKGGTAGFTTCSTDNEYVNFPGDKYHGDIFIGGLGLEININKLINNDRVNTIDVVEANQDIIDLIKPRVHVNDKVKIYTGDPLRTIPKKKYNFMLWAEYQTWLLNKDGTPLQQQMLKIKYSDEYM